MKRMITAAVAALGLAGLASGAAAQQDWTLADLGVAFDADGYFAFIGPAGMPEEARDALAAAIEAVVTAEGSKANEMITKAFGGPIVIAGDDLTDMVASEYERAGALLEAASE